MQGLGLNPTGSADVRPDSSSSFVFLDEYRIFESTISRRKEYLDQQSPRKRRNLSDQAGFCSPTSGDDDDGEEAAGAVLLPRTAREAVEREKENYFALDKTTADEENLAAFWNGMEKQMPALSRVAGGFLGALPGSGGLECDIGGVADLVGPKRASLKPGLVEAQLMIRVNKELVSLDTTEIVDLGKNWKDHIPSRPDYPVDYFDEETLSGQDSDDSDDDNDER
jgi:hypothetical protein